MGQGYSPFPHAGVLERPADDRGSGKERRVSLIRYAGTVVSFMVRQSNCMSGVHESSPVEIWG